MTESYSLKDKKILLAGQVLNSLTEMAEDYIKDKSAIVGVIGISNPFSIPDTARMTLYRNGSVKISQRIFNLYFKKSGWYSLYLYIPVFLVYLFSMIRAAFKFKVKFDIFVGIAGFSTFVGIILRKFKIVNKVIFYSIDYFPLQRSGFFENLMVRVFFLWDAFCARHSDLVWHINPEIGQARQIYGGLSMDKYHSIRVPLGYTQDLFCQKPFSRIEKYTLGFVGTLNPNQGLQMAIKAFPWIVQHFPMAKLEIIGDGFFAEEIRKMVIESPVGDKIILHGFIGDRKKVSDILSHCAVGIAPWTMDAENNVKYADPGKPKHYAFCGLPIIITHCNIIADEIEETKSGIAINYDESEFVAAVTKLFSNEALLREYKENAFKFAQRYESDNIYERAWQESINYFEDAK